MDIYFPRDGIKAEAREGDNLLDVIRAAGLSIEADCSGMRTCGMCKVRVNGALRLACETAAEDGMRVELLASSEGHVILTDSFTDETEHSRDGSFYVRSRTQKEPSLLCSSPSPLRLAFAIDVGTTTVVIKAIDTGSSDEVGVRAFVNPQRAYGADVISRINNSMDDATELSELIKGAIDRAIESIMFDEGAGAVTKNVVIAGNTTMMYLLLNLRCRSLGLAPFEPEFAIEPVYEYEDIFGTKTLDCPVLIYPFISAYVGGDIVSGLVNIERRIESGFHESYMLIDMGTNGEIAYRDGARLITTSTAAGPALEGGNITCGMGGLPGAIFKAKYAGDGKFTYETIGGLPARGICGSGVISLMAALLDAGLVSESGAFTEEAERLAEITDGAPAQKQLVIAEPPHTGTGKRVVFTQKDIREFQLAKGAIRAGLDILTEEMGEHPHTLYLAGGFGQSIELKSAFRTGLIPASLMGHILFVGNTSLGGCVIACLECDARGPLPLLYMTGRTQEINLGSHKSFNEKFMESMMFEV